MRQAHPTQNFVIFVVSPLFFAFFAVKYLLRLRLSCPVPFAVKFSQYARSAPRPGMTNANNATVTARRIIALSARDQ